MKAGAVNCVLDILVLMLATHTWGYAYFELHNATPDWVLKGLNKKAALAALNATTVPPCIVVNGTFY